ncbi:MAG: hypothetical protein UR27_C0019G0037 [Candidatus Peregrinibacteria bacterium GW2011_GWA2_33_10]|nr:MAG: hypothetical protein UR27_C0019G0037 [Candidatus Peregrinibacteria bacterium GW2011_GWA2_33_10]
MENLLSQSLSYKVISDVLKVQKNEITEYYIYKKLGKNIKFKGNREVLLKMASDELKHYNILHKITGKNIKPSKWKVYKYYYIAKILGITFGTKLLERNEKISQKFYDKFSQFSNKFNEIKNDEKVHEKYLLNMLNEERLNYIGSIVLGMNDALVELTGALAGLTFLLRNTHVIASVGLVTGIAAAFSMSASDYLANKHDRSTKCPLKSSFYTGITYLLTVSILISPYLIFHNVYLALFVTFIDGLLIIFCFNFYASVVKNISFQRYFYEMVLISLGVALFSFLIGIIVRTFLNVDL